MNKPFLALGLTLSQILSQTTFADPPKTSAWSLTFSDEFDGPALDAAKWTSGYVIEKTGPGSWADPGNVRFANGHLQLFGEKRAGEGKTFAGSAINTRGKFSQLYGYFEVRYKAAKGKGFSSKLTGIRPDAGLPPLMDMVEFRGEETNRPYWYMHYDDGAGAKEAGGGSAGPDLATDYHLFGTEWNADDIIWYIDGVEKMRAKVGPGLKHAIFFGLELMVGGSDWIGIPDASTPWPGIVEVDWIRVYQRTGPASVNKANRNALSARSERKVGKPMGYRVSGRYSKIPAEASSPSFIPMGGN